MEIKAKITKPCDDSEIIHFIYEYNRVNNYEIRETEQELQAWGYTQEELEQQEQERIANLTMTALDFIGVLEHFGLDYITEIKPFLEAQQELDKQLKYCQNVWCGVVQALCPLEVYGRTITKEMIIHAFKVKNGEE